MIGLLVLAGCSMLWLTIMLTFERKFPCKCGRMRVPYFPARHERVWVMTFWAVVVSVLEILGVIERTYFWVAVNGLATGWYWLRVWYHEKGKLKKRLDALGRVVVKDNGRLAVVHE